MFSIRSSLLFFFLNHLFFIIQFVTCKDYLIWLSANLSDGKLGQEYLHNHITSMQQIIPSFKLYHAYDNLVRSGFLIYSASIDETSQDWELFLELTEIKLVEDIISQYRVAQRHNFPLDFVPFVPPKLEEVTVSKEGNAQCTFTYNFIDQVVNDQTTLHKMVKLTFLYPA
jgi:hypothetical protein